MKLPKPGDTYHGRTIVSVREYTGKMPEIFCCTVLMTSSCTNSGTIEMAWSKDKREITDGVWE